MEHTVLNHALANLPLVRSCQKPDVSRLKRELRGKAKLYSKWISRVDLPPEGIRLLPQFENSETVTLGRFSRKLYQSILAARGAKESPEDDGSGSSEVESELSSDDLSFNSTDSDEDSVSGSSTSEYSSSNEDEVEARNALTQEMQSYFDLGETEDKRAEIARIFLAKQPPSIPPEVRILDKLEDDSVIPAIPGSASQPDPVSKDRGGRMFLNYYGTWERAEMHGNGGYVFADGGVFTGDFIHNKMQGHGEKTQSVGTFQGDFVDNKRHGTGRTKCGHGCVYEGEFVDGERSGVGKLRLPTGVVYEGEFKHGVFSGRGEIRSPLGYVYTGNWEEGLIQGTGALILPCKTRVVREWKEPISFAELIFKVREERRSKKEAKKKEFQHLCRAIVRTELNRYVAEVRDNIQREKEEAEQQEREELDRLRRERRKQINEARQAAMKAAEGMEE